MRKRLIGLALAACAAVALAASRLLAPAPLSAEELAARLAQPLPAPSGPLAVYHIGHSLVGREMPLMLTAMAPGGHVSHSQLGWGASLAQHWKGDVPGFAEENASPAFRPAGEAIDSGRYDAIVLTEMVELRDAIRWQDSAASLARWAARARAARPGVRLYLYETWHRLDDPAGWAERIAADRSALWEGQLLAPAMAQRGVGTIYVIPAGQVLAAVAARAEAGALPGVTSRRDLFSDEIHLSALGQWLVALTHHAVLYQRPPETGAALAAGGKALADLPEGTPEQLIAIVWQRVLDDPATGIPRQDGPRP